MKVTQLKNYNRKVFLTEKEIEKVIDMKVNQCVEGVHFVYINSDGEIKLGYQDQYGQDNVVAFAGYSKNKKQARHDIDNIIDSGRSVGDYIIIEDR